MNNKEFTFSGTTLNGFLMLFGNIILTLASIAGIIYGIILENDLGGVLIGLSVAVLITTFFLWGGFIML